MWIKLEPDGFDPLLLNLAQAESIAINEHIQHDDKILYQVVAQYRDHKKRIYGWCDKYILFASNDQEESKAHMENLYRLLSRETS